MIPSKGIVKNSGGKESGCYIYLEIVADNDKDSMLLNSGCYISIASVGDSDTY